MKHSTTILIVDDELFGRKALGGLLAGQDYQIIFATSGLEALDLAKENIPDLILLDVMMPDIDGFEVCQRLRSDNLLADIPILMVTGLDDPQSRLQGLEAGADDFITKPYNAIELRARIRTISRLNRYKRLLQERAKFEQTVEFSPNGIIIIDLAGTISLINPAMLRMLILENTTPVIGQSIFQFVSKNSQENLSKLLEQGQQQAVLNQEIEFLASNNTTFPAEVDIGGFLLEHKGMLQVIVRDLTEKKKLQAMLLRNQRQEILGTISGSIAHDLKNVLTPIMIATEMLENHIDERGQRFINMIKRGCNHGVSLIQQILKFSKGGKTQTNTIEITNLISEIHEMISLTMSKVVKVTTKVPEDLWLAVGDATQLHQVILNLCVNARDAMPDGGELSLRAENVFWTGNKNHPTSGYYVAIHISDTGMGMSKETLAQIFEPFFTTKGEEKGTGLGLFTVQTIIRNHSGFIQVHSELNKGTTFTIYIPALKVVEEETLELPFGQGEYILVVNNEVSLGEIIKESLESHGYNVFLANNLIDIIISYNKAKEQQINISTVLLDITNSASNAQEILDEIKNMDREVKIISVGNENLVGTDQYLSKSHSVFELLSTLKKVNTAKYN
jgi:two-component system, cell cycle sensor histidine kinase and response regulator CckA